MEVFKLCGILYRKKDRVHADALMRQIHSYEALRDIAIWYDEYLVPGENFEKNIRERLETSELLKRLKKYNDIFVIEVIKIRQQQRRDHASINA